MAEMQHRCPNCGNPLEMDVTGRIGKCPVHRWVPVAPGSAGEAAQKNIDEDNAAKQAELDKKIAKDMADEVERKRRKAARTRAILLVLVALIAAAVVYVLMVVRPGMEYDAAGEKLAAGEYAQAHEAYTALGNYKDASDRALLCDVMLDMSGGNAADAIAKLDALIGGGDAAVTAMLGDTLLPIMQDWQAEGIAPADMLQLLARRDSIDAAGALDYAALSHQAHAGLLEGMIANAARDVDGDGEVELIALDGEYMLYAYDMLPDGNARITIDAAASAGSMVAFGDTYMDRSVDEALACYQAAYAYVQDELTGGKLAAAYRARATRLEAEGDAAAALADARQAVEASGAADDFAFYYDMMLRGCTGESDKAVGISNWDAFLLDEGAMVQRFEARERGELDAGALRLQYAAVLSAAHDDLCLTMIREAHELGADVNAALSDAIAQQNPGLLLAQLRAEAVALAADDAAKADQRALLESDVLTAVSGWQGLGLEGAEALQLIRFADENAIELTGVDREEVYHAAAIDAAYAAEAASNLFVNWDGDAYEELLTIDAAGELRYMALGEAWSAAYLHATGLVDAKLTVYDCEVPMLLISAADGFEVLSYGAQGIKPVLREDGIVNLSIEGAALTYERMLPGSIERLESYAYTVDSLAARPVSTGIASHGPVPADAVQTVIRWLEAHAYGITAEKVQLTSDETLDALPVPDDATALTVAPCDVQEDHTLLEAVYMSSGKEARYYFTAVNDGDMWQLTGASAAFSADVAEWEADNSLPLLALNQAATGSLADKKAVNSYRVLLPQTSEVSLLWQAGAENKSRTAFVVTLYSAEDMTKPVISYELALSTSKQMSNPLFLAPGVYYVSVSAGSYYDVPYSLTLQAIPDPYVESESNGSIAEADAIETNQPYTGSLKDAKDVDCYAVTLSEPGRLNVNIQAGDEGKKQARYSVAVASENGTLLTSFQMAGNVKNAASCNLYVDAGRYIVQVSKGSYESNAAYELTAAFEPMAGAEQEQNSAADAATAIEVNQAVTGSFGAKGDEDWFTFTLANDSVIQPALSFTPLNTSSRTYVLTIMDGAQTLMSVNIGGKENQKVIVPLALKAGTYQIKLTNPNFIMQDYALTVNAMTVALAEAESNDALALATELAVGSDVTGVISHEDDVDMYKLTLAEQTEATLSFSFPASAVEGTVYTVRLEQNGKAAWSANVKGSSGGFEQALLIPAGEYYVVVKPSTWISAVYTIGLK